MPKLYAFVCDYNFASRKHACLRRNEYKMTAQWQTENEIARSTLT